MTGQQFVDSLAIPRFDQFPPNIIGWAGYLRVLTPAIVQAAHANNLGVLLIDEHTATESLETADRWQARANLAVGQAQRLGAPAGMGVAIMLTADTDIPASRWPTVEAGWRVAGPILRAAGYLRGFYAGEDLLDHLLDLGLIDVAWGVGATSWNHGHFSKRIEGRQLPRQGTVGGVTVDFNDIFSPVSELGMWWPHPIPQEDDMPLSDDDVTKVARAAASQFLETIKVDANGVPVYPEGNTFRAAVVSAVGSVLPAAVADQAGKDAVAKAVADELAERLKG